MGDLSPLLIWSIAGLVGLATPAIGFFSPFGRARRSMVADLQREIDGLTRQVKNLRDEATDLTEKLQQSQTNLLESERERGRLQRENYRLYRELDGRPG